MTKEYDWYDRATEKDLEDSFETMPDEQLLEYINNYKEQLIDNMFYVEIEHHESIFDKNIDHMNTNHYIRTYYYLENKIRNIALILIKRKSPLIEKWLLPEVD